MKSFKREVLGQVTVQVTDLLLDRVRVRIRNQAGGRAWDLVMIQVLGRVRDLVGIGIRDQVNAQVREDFNGGR